MPFKNPHPLYCVWHSMKERCRNPRFRQWMDYGGRGITVCDEWKTDFHRFVADMGPRPDGYVIDRIDNDAGYSPANCRWASKRDSQNNRRVTVRLEIEGRSYLLADLARMSGLKPDTIKDRAQKLTTLAEILSPERRRDMSGLALGGPARREQAQRRRAGDIA